MYSGIRLPRGTSAQLYVRCETLPILLLRVLFWAGPDRYTTMQQSRIFPSAWQTTRPVDFAPFS